MNKFINVLIIDDDEDGRFAFKRFLTRVPGFELNVIEAETGEEGLEKYQPRLFDIVLLDYSLPGISGVDVLARLKAEDADAPVVMLTGQGDENIAVEAMKLGAIDYLPKDKVNLEAMSRVLTHAIEQTELKRKVREQRQELESFASVLAHDLKTPLGGVLSFAELLLLKTADEEKYKDIRQEIQFIYQSGQHMTALINSLQQYVHGGGDVPFTAFPLKDALDQATRNLATIITERNAVVHLDSDLPTLEGSKAQVVQLFQNLIANGIKYCKACQPEIAIGAKSVDGGMVITVKDNGIGIPEDQTKEIFGAFVRLHHGEEIFEGTGLGLATCKRIVERHKGRIWCTSQVGHGSSFHVFLPSA